MTEVYIIYMKKYIIYHIAGIKIGVTSNLIKRMSDQGFTEWEILEEHTDIYEVSDREIELQKQYGLPVDAVPYWQSVQNRRKFTKEEMSRGGRNSIDQMRSKLTKEALSRGGKNGKGIPKAKTKCPHCNRMIANNLFDRWHGNKCKQKY